MAFVFLQSVQTFKDFYLHENVKNLEFHKKKRDF